MGQARKQNTARGLQDSRRADLISQRRLRAKPYEGRQHGQARHTQPVTICDASAICAYAAASAHTGARSALIGVVSAHATTYLDSFLARRVVEAPVTTLLADGMFFFSSRRRHTRYWRDWSSDVCSSD